MAKAKKAPAKAVKKVTAKAPANPATSLQYQIATSLGSKIMTDRDEGDLQAIVLIAEENYSYARDHEQRERVTKS